LLFEHEAIGDSMDIHAGLGLASHSVTVEWYLGERLLADPYPVHQT